MSSSSFSSLPADLREAIESYVEIAVEQRIEEILGDPDEGSELHDDLRRRLLDQQRRVAVGERGRSLNEVIRGVDSQQ